jgi:NADPH:quinone reductase
MRAVRVDEFGGPEVLVVRDTPEPVPGPGQVLVEVSGVNIIYLDTLIRSGLAEAVTTRSACGSNSKDQM